MKNICEHTIILNEFVSISVNIPKTCNISEFDSLMKLVQQTMKLRKIKLLNEELQDLDDKPKGRMARFAWTDDLKQLLKTNAKSKTIPQLIEFFKDEKQVTITHRQMYRQLIYQKLSFVKYPKSEEKK